MNAPYSVNCLQIFTAFRYNLEVPILDFCNEQNTAENLENILKWAQNEPNPEAAALNERLDILSGSRARIIAVPPQEIMIEDMEKENHSFPDAREILGLEKLPQPRLSEEEAAKQKMAHALAEEFRNKYSSRAYFYHWNTPIVNDSESEDDEE